MTLTGSGGVGKTRLALAVAAELLEQFPGGVWFVELVGVADPAEVGSAVSAAMGVHHVPGLQPAEQVIAALAEERTLLVLDNCEHLLDPCAALTAALLAQHAAVSVLATAREPLGVPGEVTWRVRSLSAPPPETTMAVSALSQYDAVRLFIDGARRARPTFVVSEANAPAIAHVCHRLDGIPLALELAAARCRQMSVERIAAELDDRFHLLTGGARTVLPRQQTLAASVDWSYDRLDEIEQVLFRRLGVFARSFPMDAADTRGGDRRRRPGGGVRCGEPPGRQEPGRHRGAGWRDEHYRLLETLRAYATNEPATPVSCVAPGCTGDFWLDWLDRHEPIVHTDVVIRHIEMFHDSVAAALDWSTREPAVGSGCCGSSPAPGKEAGARSGLTAVDRLLTDENAEQFPVPWVGRRRFGGRPVGTARGWPEAHELLRRGRWSPRTPATTTSSRSATCCSATPRRLRRVRQLAHERGTALRRVHRHHGRGFDRGRSGPERGVGDARRRGLSGRSS